MIFAKAASPLQVFFVHKSISVNVPQCFCQVQIKAMQALTNAATSRRRRVGQRLHVVVLTMVQNWSELVQLATTPEKK